MTAPDTVAKPNITLDRRAPSRHDSTLEALPDMIVFSSDYPHSEGNADPVALYSPRLENLPADVRADFMCHTIRDRFARMGDPVME